MSSTRSGYESVDKPVTVSLEEKDSEDVTFDQSAAEEHLEKLLSRQSTAQHVHHAFLYHDPLFGIHILLVCLINIILAVAYISFAVSCKDVAQTVVSGNATEVIQVHSCDVYGLRPASVVLGLAVATDCFWVLVIIVHVLFYFERRTFGQPKHPLEAVSTFLIWAILCHVLYQYKFRSYVEEPALTRTDQVLTFVLSMAILWFIKGVLQQLIVRVLTREWSKKDKLLTVKEDLLNRMYTNYQQDPLEKLEDALNLNRITGVNWENPESTPSHLLRLAETERVAIAKKVFTDIDAGRNRKFLHKEDFASFYADQCEVEIVWQIFSVDCTENDKVYKHEFVRILTTIWAARIRIEQERENKEYISVSIDRILDALAVLFVILIGIKVFVGSDLALTVSTTLLSFSWIFGNTIKEYFEAFLFVFVDQRLHVGELVTVKGHTIKVTDMNVRCTTGVSYEGKLISFSNTALIKEPIQNLSRTTGVSLSLKLSAGLGTTMAQVLALKKLFVEYINGHPESYKPNPGFSLTTADCLEKLNIGFFVKLNKNWTGSWVAQRTAVIAFLHASAIKVGISLGATPVRVFKATDSGVDDGSSFNADAIHTSIKELSA